MVPARRLALAAGVAAGMLGGAAGPAGVSATTSTASQREVFSDPLAVRPLNPNFDLYPDSSLADFSHLLEAPAGRRGFVESRDDGHLYFADGTRARFWGVVITQEHIDIPKERIDVVVDVLARAGCNMVRFHSLDNRAGYEYGFVRRTVIDDAPPHDNDSQHLDPEYLDRLDYWVARLKERGIYSFIVLRAFRQFREGDEVQSAGALPRAARPMAFFNKRLIELQVAFARQLLFEHVNPYTHLPLGKDPAVGLVELFNEDSLFSRPSAWHSMPEPYQGEFQTLWIDYLRRSYGSTEGLREAWKNDAGVTALAAGESIEKGNVALPDMAAGEPYEKAQLRDHTSPKVSPTRRRDAVRFAIELQREYFVILDEALRGLGLRVPMTGVVAGGVLPDTFSVASELGFTAENMYQEHPSFEPGRDWLPPFYYANGNYLRDDSVRSGLPFIARYRWAGKPLAVREWATSWPNHYRASSMLEMAGYGRFQDLDAIMYFAYYTTGDFTRLGPFTLGNDPTRWGLFGVGAQAFLGEETISPAQRTVAIGHSAEDLSAFGSWDEEVYQLAWIHKLENVLLTPDTKAPGDLLVMAGRSHDTGWPGNLALIRSIGSHVTAAQRVPAKGQETVWAKSGYPLDASKSDGVNLTFDGTGFDNGATTAVENATLFRVTQLKAQQLIPIGVAEDGALALGGYHQLRKNLVLGGLPTALVTRFAIDLMHYVYETPMTHKDLDAGLYLADTGELVRDTAAGRYFMDSARIQAVAGQFTTGSMVSTPSGTMSVQSLSKSGAIVAVSLDGRTLAYSRQFLVKMVTIAENRKQLLEAASHPDMAGKYVMLTEGGTPIVTNGRPAQGRFTSVEVAGRPVISAGMTDGTWELLVDLDQGVAHLACDTPNVPFKVLLPPESPAAEYTMTRHQNESGDGRGPEKVGREFVYPGWAKFVSLEF